MENSSQHFQNLNRRSFLVAGGIAVTSIAALPATPACTLASEQEEGPYYIDDETLRRDITEGKPGVPIILAVRLFNAGRKTSRRRLGFAAAPAFASGAVSPCSGGLSARFSRMGRR